MATTNTVLELFERAREIALEQWIDIYQDWFTEAMTAKELRETYRLPPAVWRVISQTRAKRTSEQWEAKYRIPLRAIMRANLVGHFRPLLIEWFIRLQIDNDELDANPDLDPSEKLASEILGDDWAGDLAEVCAADHTARRAAMRRFMEEQKKEWEERRDNPPPTGWQ